MFLLLSHLQQLRNHFEEVVGLLEEVAAVLVDELFFHHLLQEGTPPLLQSPNQVQVLHHLHEDLILVVPNYLLEVGQGLVLERVLLDPAVDLQDPVQELLG
mmetsp:Transcript_25392/g.24741  ORF Transcript_25392/g.24741 Transcript_25392/m.24741 type:complete len:101 (-) Transcript_25392:1108-1410(-)